MRTLNEQVSLETRTRTLNPKWYESMLKHGYEGVRQIEVACDQHDRLVGDDGAGRALGLSAPDRDLCARRRDARTSRASSIPPPRRKIANRLIEAHERRYWTPDAETLAALQQASDELEDRLEGVVEEIAA